MCELFAMNASHPTGVGRSLARLKPRGGLTGPHGDGWGVAYYEGRAARIHKEPTAAANSRVLALLADEDLRSQCVIAHIRKANPSVFGRAVANTHPFEREWNGHSWVFAHNGKLPGVKAISPVRGGRFQPLGETDSEHAFCMIMNTLSGAFTGRVPPRPDHVARLVAPLARRLAALGEFNFLLSDGTCLYAHAQTRLHEWHWADRDPSGRERRGVLLATQPLTDAAWRPLAPDVIHVYADGQNHGSSFLPARKAA